MEVLQLRPSGPEPLLPLVSSRQETSFERVKRYFSRVPSTPLSITVSSVQSSLQLQQTSSAATSVATATDRSLTTSTPATSIVVDYETFQTQGLYVSPNMLMEQDVKDLWTQQIRFRLSAELHHHVGHGPWLQQFMMAGKRPDDLSPFIVITCGDLRTRKKVEKLCKNLKWLRVLAKSYNIKFAALVAEITLTAGLAPLVTGMQAIDDSCSVDVPDSATTFCGQRIYITHSDGLSASQCTFGGLIAVDGTLYGLTAGHPFATQNITAEAEFEIDVGRQPVDYPEESENSETDTTSDPDFIFSHDSSDDGEQTSGASSTSTGPLSDTHNAIDWSSQPGKNLTDTAKSGVKPRQVEVLLPTTPSIVSLPRHRLTFNLDWALIGISNLPYVLPNQVILRETEGGDASPILGTPPAQFEPRGEVIVLTTINGPQSGYLNASPASLKIGGGLYDVRMITLSQTLAPGSSGALVILNNYVCGFIIASRQDVPWAYMVLIHPILNDIKRVLKAREVGFPSTADINRLTAPPASESRAHIGELASSSVSRHDADPPFASGDPDLERGADDPLISNPFLTAHSVQHDLDSWQQESEYVYPSMPVVSPLQVAEQSYIWRVGDLYTHFLAWIFLVCFDFLSKIFRRA